MKLLSSLHNPKHNRYVSYYCTVLVIILITGSLMNLGMIKVSFLETSMLYFEGFSSLFMLVRNERVGNAFLTHISKLQVLRGRYLN